MGPKFEADHYRERRKTTEGRLKPGKDCNACRDYAMGTITRTCGLPGEKKKDAPEGFSGEKDTRNTRHQMTSRGGKEKAMYCDGERETHNLLRRLTIRIEMRDTILSKHKKLKA